MQQFKRLYQNHSLDIFRVPSSIHEFYGEVIPQFDTNELSECIGADCWAIGYMLEDKEIIVSYNAYDHSFDEGKEFRDYCMDNTSEVIKLCKKIIVYLYGFHNDSSYKLVWNIKDGKCYGVNVWKNH